MVSFHTVFGCILMDGFCLNCLVLLKMNFKSTTVELHFVKPLALAYEFDTKNAFLE